MLRNFINMERADLWELEAEGVKGSRSIAEDWVVQVTSGGGWQKLGS